MQYERSSMESKSTPRSGKEYAQDKRKSLSKGFKQNSSQNIKPSLTPKLNKQSTIKNFLQRNSQRAEESSRHRHCSNLVSEEPF